MNTHPAAPLHASASPRVLRPLLPVALVWFAIGLAASLTGAFSRAPFVAPIAVLAGSAALVIGARRWAPLGALAARVPTRAILFAQALRAPIGALFLVEHALGRLPATFAIRGGWGDIAAGLGALALALATRRGREPSRALALVWGLFGLADILLVVGTAGYLAVGLRDPLLLSAFDRFPYGLLPIVVVPLVISTHVLMLTRARGLPPRDDLAS